MSNNYSVVGIKKVGDSYTQPPLANYRNQTIVSKNQAETWLLRDKYKGQESSAFLADCQRLSGGVPLGYVIGWVPFLNTKIYLDSKPLIPRSETEHWTEQAINSIWAKENDSLSVLDLCAGSGCIGVAVLKAAPTTMVDFVEIDQKHRQTIRKNIEINAGPAANCHLIQGDLFTN